MKKKGAEVAVDAKAAAAKVDANVEKMKAEASK